MPFLELMMATIEESGQCDLLAWKPHRFNGSDYVPSRDDARLSGQVERVFRCMADGQWRSLEQIAAATGDPQASISAQLRHLRKRRFGGHTVEKRYEGNGLFLYKLTIQKGGHE